MGGGTGAFSNMSQMVVSGEYGISESTSPSILLGWGYPVMLASGPHDGGMPRGAGDQPSMSGASPSGKSVLFGISMEEQREARARRCSSLNIWRRKQKQKLSKREGGDFLYVLTKKIKTSSTINSPYMFTL